MGEVALAPDDLACVYQIVVDPHVRAAIAALSVATFAACVLAVVWLTEWINELLGPGRR